MISPDAYQKFGEGQISEEELRQLETLDLMLKSASAASSAWHSGLGKTLTQGLAMGAAGGTGAALGAGAAMGGKKLWDKATYNRDMKKILDVYPQLKDYPKKDLNLAYSSLRHMNPHFSKDPLVGGTMLTQILKQRDPTNPESIRFDGALAADLVKARPHSDDPMTRALADSFARGMSGAIEERGRQRAAKDDRAWRADQSKLDREHRTKQSRIDRMSRKREGARGAVYARNLERDKHDNALVREALKKELEWYGPAPSTDSRRRFSDSREGKTEMDAHLRSRWGIEPR